MSEISDENIISDSRRRFSIIFLVTDFCFCGTGSDTNGSLGESVIEPVCKIPSAISD